MGVVVVPFSETRTPWGFEWVLHRLSPQQLLDYNRLRVDGSNSVAAVAEVLNPQQRVSYELLLADGHCAVDALFHVICHHPLPAVNTGEE